MIFDTPHKSFLYSSASPFHFHYPLYSQSLSLSVPLSASLCLSFTPLWLLLSWCPCGRAATLCGNRLLSVMDVHSSSRIAKWVFEGANVKHLESRATWQCVMGFSARIFLIFLKPVNMSAASAVRFSLPAYPVPCFMCTCKLLSVSRQAHLILQSSSTKAQSVAAPRQPGPEALVVPMSTAARSTRRQAGNKWGRQRERPLCGREMVVGCERGKKSLTNEKMKETENTKWGEKE